MIEALACALLVGLSVDYLAHLNNSYVEAPSTWSSVRRVTGDRVRAPFLLTLALSLAPGGITFNDVVDILSHYVRRLYTPLSPFFCVEL